MTILPIIIRELRAEARRPVNYWLRTFGAAAMTILFGVLLSNQPNTHSGKQSFDMMSLLIFFGIWIVVPILSADCISREKREGTLGLLFLTPLRAIEIILGKGSIHAMRSLTLIIAVLPVLAIPFVLGGITKADVLCSLVLDLTALCLALAAGLLASSFARQWSRALILAEIFAACFALIFLKLMLFVVGLSSGNLSEVAFDVLHMFFFTSQNLGMGMVPPGGVPTVNSILPIAISFLAEAVLIFFLVMLFAAFRLKSSWQENAPSLRQEWLQKTFCTPRYWLDTFQRRNHERLSRNPVGWLQQYSWSARLSKWGWCFVIISFISWLIGTDFTMLHRGCNLLKYGLLASIAFSAVSSFQREKQNGALELLLVTPLQEGQIIRGRLWGIWGQFLPAFAILILSVIVAPNYSKLGNYFGSDWPEFEIFPAIRDFIVVPIVGLYFALQIKNFLAAWFLTCLLTLFLPAFLLPAIFNLIDNGGTTFNSLESNSIRLIQTVFLTMLGIWAASRLYNRLKTRSFVFVSG